MSYADATDYFIGTMPQLAAATLAVNVMKFDVPFDSFLRNITWQWRAIPVNATEIVTWEMQIFDRLSNRAKDKRPVAWFPLQQSFGASAVDNAWQYQQDVMIPMKKGDSFIFRINQTWTNNPTNISMNVNCTFQVT